MDGRIDTLTAMLTATLFLASLFVVTLVDARSDVYGEFLRKTPPTADSLLDGSWARGADAWLEDSSRAMRLSRPYWNESMLVWFRETPSRFCVGKDGWLFVESSLTPLVEPTAQTSFRNSHAIVDFVRGLARIGNARFRVLIMPSKWRLYEEKLIDGFRVPDDRRALYARIIASLRAKGIDAPDVLEFLREERSRRPDVLLYPPNDTHFSQAGFIRVVQRYVPDWLEVPPNVVRDRLARLPRHRHLHHGDILRHLSIRPNSSAGRRYAFAEDALDVPPAFDMPGAEVLVLGDSFFRHYDGLFQRLIQAASERTVDGRYAGWNARPEVGRMVVEYRARPCRYLLFAVSERRFATL